MNKPDFSEYIYIISSLQECIAGVKLADGSTINSTEARRMAFGALESVLRHLDAELAARCAEMPPPDVTLEVK